MGRDIYGLYIQPTKTKDKETAILVIVDKLSKRAHFIALADNHTAEKIAEVF